MMFKKKLAVAIFAAGISSQAAAVEIGEFNGTKFKIGGYVKAQGIHTQDEADDGNGFDGSMRESRLNFAAEREIDGHKLRGFIEVDFWDNSIGPLASDGSYSLRLRHAYIAVDNFTVGQTWNGQFFSSAPLDVRVVDFFGPGAGTMAGNGALIRPDLLVHYTLGGLRLTAQEPADEGANYPDMVAGYTYRTDGHAFNLAVAGRDVMIDRATDETELGAAVSAAAKLQFGGTTLSLTGFTGEGAGVYAGWGYDGAYGGPNSLDVNTATGDLITTTGLSAGVKQKLTDKLYATVRYGQVKADETAAGVDDTLAITNVNLMYSYMPSLDLGIEWRDNSQSTRPTLVTAPGAGRSEGQQVEVMARYKF